MDKIKAALMGFFASIAMLILTLLIGLYLLNTASYVWQNARSIEDVFPLIGDFTIICLYGFLKWLGIFASIAIAAIVAGYVALHELGLMLERYKARRMSPVYIDTATEGGEGGGSIPTPEPKYFDPNAIGEKVKKYLESINDYQFSFTSYGEVERIYEYIGYRPGGKNKQEENYNFAKVLLSSKFFEQEGKTNLKLKSLYWKTTEQAAKTFDSAAENYKRGDLVDEVKTEYKSDKNQTLVGQI